MGSLEWEEKNWRKHMYRSRKEDQRKNVAVERMQNRSRCGFYFFNRWVLLCLYTVGNENC